AKPNGCTNAKIEIIAARYLTVFLLLKSKSADHPVMSTFISMRPPTQVASPRDFPDRTPIAWGCRQYIGGCDSKSFHYVSRVQNSCAAKADFQTGSSRIV